MNKLNRETFFRELKTDLFPQKFIGAKGSKQIKGIDLLIDEWERRDDVNLQQFAYILATTYHETAFTMQPIKERGGQKYLQSKKYYPYFGRGYVQLTWETNYKKVSKKYGVDFMSNPDLALDPKYAVPILFDGMKEGWFTKYSLDSTIDNVDDPDEKEVKEYVKARRIVNGTDKAHEIASYALKFEKALYKAWMVNVEPIKKDTGTLGGSAGTAAGGAIVLGDGITGVSEAVSNNQDLFTSGDIWKVLIGLVIISGALWVLYSRWDAAGRPKFWQSKK
jgi:hypothetical protein